MHEVERFFRLAHGAIKAWGGTPAWDAVPEQLGMKLLARHEAAARNLMAEHGIPENFALLAPIARGLHHGKEKQWKHFNELCDPLRSMGIEPIIFPSAREEEANRAACPNATILPAHHLGQLCRSSQAGPHRHCQRLRHQPCRRRRRRQSDHASGRNGPRQNSSLEQQGRLSRQQHGWMALSETSP